MSPRSPRVGLLLIALSGVLWGTIPLLVRSIEPIVVDVRLLGGGIEMTSAVIVFWRVAFSAIALAMIITARRSWSVLISTGRRSLLALIMNGVLLATHWVLFFGALTMTDVAIAEFLTFTGPIYVAALIPLVSSEDFDRRVLPPIVLALVGLAVILAPEMVAPKSSSEVTGAIMALLAALTYAALMLNTKRLLSGIPMTTIMFTESAVAAVFLAPIALSIPQPQGSNEWAALLTLGLFHSVAVVFIFMTGLRSVRADHASALTYAEPVSAVLYATVLLGEPPTIYALVGGIAVVAAGILVARLEPSPGAEGPMESLAEVVD